MKESKKLVLKKETLRDLMVRNDAEVKGGTKTGQCASKQCVTMRQRCETVLCFTRIMC